MLAHQRLRPRPQGNHVVRKLAANGTITTVAGSYAPGSVASSGDGGPASAAVFTAAQGIAVDDAGDLLIADSVSHGSVGAARAWGGAQAGTSPQRSRYALAVP